LYEQKQAYYKLENIFGFSIILILTLQINYIKKFENVKKTPSPIASKNKKPQKENFIMDSFILNFC
jgi:hypothetical protein